MKVKTLIGFSDKQFEKEINRIGYGNIRNILFSVDSHNDGYGEIIKIIYNS